MIFAILMFVVFGKLLVLAIGLGWGLLKVILTVVFLPLILLGAAAIGLLKLALPVLIIIGVLSWLSSPSNSIV